MNRTNFSSLIAFALLATLSFGFTCCSGDGTAPKIYLLAKDGKTIDKVGDTTILLYTKYVDPGCIVEDNASTDENIQIAFDGESVLPIEKKNASHMGEVKKTGTYQVTYTATDEAGNVGTRSKNITIRNVSDIYTGRYWTEREATQENSWTDMGNDTTYYSNVSANTGVAGRLRFSKVALHKYNGQVVSFKIDADLYSDDPALSKEFSKQIGYLGTAEDKEKCMYDGMTYEQAVDTIRHKYIYLDIPIDNEEYTAYTESEDTVGYKVRIRGIKENGKPKSRIEYDDYGLFRIILELDITFNNQSVQNYKEVYTIE